MEPTLLEQIRVAQLADDELVKIRAEVGKSCREDFGISEDGALRYRNRLCVPKENNLKRVILVEAHQSLYTVHPGSTIMYRDLKSTIGGTALKGKLHSL